MSFRMTNFLYERIVEKLRTDTGSLAHATDACVVQPVVNNFLESINLQVADLSWSDDLDQIVLTAGAQQSSRVPGVGNWQVEMIPDAGGLRWELASDLEADVTVYGFALMDVGETTLLAYLKLETPVVVRYAGDFVECPIPKIVIPKSAF